MNEEQIEKTKNEVKAMLEDFPSVLTSNYKIQVIVTEEQSGKENKCEIDTKVISNPVSRDSILTLKNLVGESAIGLIKIFEDYKTLL